MSKILSISIETSVLVMMLGSSDCMWPLLYWPPVLVTVPHTPSARLVGVSSSSGSVPSLMVPLGKIEKELLILDKYISFHYLTY
jgi:hypothetical protein